jgi:hypothetical protein
VEESWEWLRNMGHRWLLSGDKDQNTIVVPCFDHGHWTVFVLEDTKKYHFGTGMDVHDNMGMAIMRAWSGERGAGISYFNI